MNYSISDEVPQSWDHIVTTFVNAAQFHGEFNRGTPMESLNFGVKRGLLDVTYTGGDKTIDAFAFFAREMSGAICYDCNALATRSVFTYPKCDDCI